MVKRLLSLLFLAFFFSFAQADDKVKHDWLPLFSGGWAQASIYIDTLSIKKLDTNTWEFLGSTSMAVGNAVVSFEDGDDKTITLPRPAFVLFYHIKVNCATESLVSFKTDYYDEFGKLILSYKVDPNQIIPVAPGYDTTVMFEHFCHKKPSKRTDT